MNRVLFITKNIEFATSIKAALERTGSYEVRPFSLPDAAAEYLREYPHDVAIIDFSIPGMRVDEVVEKMRAAAPQIAIVATPKQHEEVMRLLKLQNSINVPFSARYIIPVLEKALTDIRSSPPPLPRTRPSARTINPTTQLLSDDTPVMGENPAGWPAESEDAPLPPPSQVDPAFQEILSALDPSVPPPSQSFNEFDQLVDSMRGDRKTAPLPTRQQQYVDFVLKGGIESLIDPDAPLRADAGAPEAPKSGLSQRTFERLAQEEPPRPTLEESGTVSDLITGVNEHSFRNVLSILRGDEPEDTPPPTNIFPDVRDAPPDFPPGWDDLPPPELPPVPLYERDEVSTPVPPPVTYDFDHLPPAPPETLPEAPGLSPAKLILEETQNTSKWLRAFSLEDLLASIEREQSIHKPRIRPLPSWVKESKAQRKKSRDKGAPEPEFLGQVPPDTLPEALPPAPSDAVSLSQQFADQPTRLSGVQPIEEAPGDMETIWDFMRAADREKTAPPESLPESIPTYDQVMGYEIAEADGDYDDIVGDDFSESQVEAVALPHPDTPAHLAWDDVSPFVLDGDDEWTQYPAPMIAPEAARLDIPVEEVDALDLPRFSIEDFNTEFERLSAWDMAVRQNPALADNPPVEDPYLAQLALSLTQVSLELTADATLLTHDSALGGAMVAYAGHMAAEEVEELRAMIADDWRVGEEEARMRFITLPSSGKDCMLYSRRTVDDLILSLVFAGTTPLKDIRRQGRRLLEALKTVPDLRSGMPLPAYAPPMSAPHIVRMEPPPDLGPYNEYACVWLLRNPSLTLDEPVVQAIIAGMNTQLHEAYWRIRDLRARDEYVYLLADVPGEMPAFTIMRDLKRRSAEIAHKTNPELPEALWADSYLLVTPGRPLDEDEIRQFINFERMS
ncbi:MAG: hypothetical protein SF162_17485 [bacterium]|nr:hypothetical protein [bacterium]